jgi:hypothetical protein
VGDHRLSGRAKLLQRQPDLVGRGRRHAAFRQPDQHALDLSVLPSAVEGFDHRHDRHGAAADRGERIDRILVGQRIAQVEFQDRLAWRRRGLGGARRHDDQQERHADQEKHQAREDAGRGDEELLHKEVRQEEGSPPKLHGPAFRSNEDPRLHPTGKQLVAPAPQIGLLR